MNIISKSDLYGGKGGTAFQDNPDNKAITNLSLRCDKFIHQISLTYENGRTFYHGGPGGSSEQFHFGQDEHITKITVVASKRKIRHLEFTTNRNRTVRSSSTNEKEYQKTKLEAPEGCVLVGVYGRAGMLLDGIGFLWGIQPDVKEMVQGRTSWWVPEDKDKGGRDSTSTPTQEYFGGIGGESFNDGVNNGRITGIEVRSGNAIDELFITYTSESIEKETSHGGSGGSDIQCLTMYEGEYVTEVHVMYNSKRVMQLVFKTTHRRLFGPCGCNEDEKGQGTFIKDVVKAPPGHVLLGIRGTAGQFLHSIGFHWGLPPKY